MKSKMVSKILYYLLFAIFSSSSITYASIETYRYDEAGNRIAKISDHQTTYYIGSGSEETWKDGLTSEGISHYYANGQRIATLDSEGLKYLYSDHLGSSSRVGDSAGHQVKSQVYGPYGENAGEEGTASQKYKYTGKEEDGTGLYYYQARYYQADLGRFASADSTIPDPFDARKLNRFSYVENNPLGKIDPDGHDSKSYNIVLNWPGGKTETVLVPPNPPFLTSVEIEKAFDTYGSIHDFDMNSREITFSVFGHTVKVGDVPADTVALVFTNPADYSVAWPFAISLEDFDYRGVHVSPFSPFPEGPSESTVLTSWLHGPMTFTNPDDTASKEVFPKTGVAHESRTSSKNPSYSDHKYPFQKPANGKNMFPIGTEITPPPADCSGLFCFGEIRTKYAALTPAKGKPNK
jgi:RHS repeat-associated protein